MVTEPRSGTGKGETSAIGKVAVIKKSGITERDLARESNRIRDKYPAQVGRMTVLSTQGVAEKYYRQNRMESVVTVKKTG